MFLFHRKQTNTNPKRTHLRSMTFNTAPQWTIERIAGLLMHALVLLLIFGTYYVIFIVTLLPQAASQPARTVLLSLFYNVLVLMCLLCYWRCVLTNPGATPLFLCAPRRRARRSPFAICRTCRVPKPPRSHHCSMCGMCVLKQDHHCPWINTCVGFRNQKFFFQFLVYTVLLCIVGGSIAVANIDWSLFSPTKDEPPHAIHRALDADSHCRHCRLARSRRRFAVRLSLLFAGAQPNHARELHQGHQSLQSRLETPQFEQVMGPFSLMWLLPVHTTPGNGVDFLVRGNDGRPGCEQCLNFFVFCCQSRIITASFSMQIRESLTTSPRRLSLPPAPPLSDAADSM
jgi:hypothetical protein